MIVRNVNGKLVFITEIGKSEDEFLQKNPTGGFLKVDPADIPESRYGNYKWENDTIVVDQEKEDEQAAKQYQLDRVYPKIAEQLDMIFRDIANGTLTDQGEFYTAIKAAKDEVPKPD